jgi:hypothetical protein
MGADAVTRGLVPARAAVFVILTVAHNLVLCVGLVVLDCIVDWRLDRMLLRSLAIAMRAALEETQGCG